MLPRYPVIESGGKSGTDLLAPGSGHGDVYANTVSPE